MQAIDTNVLVFAEIRSAPQHGRARTVLRELAEGGAAWALHDYTAYWRGSSASASTAARGFAAIKVRASQTGPD